MQADVGHAPTTSAFVNYCSEHVEIGKQSFLKKRWNFFLKSSSLFVRI